MKQILLSLVFTTAIPLSSYASDTVETNAKTTSPDRIVELFTSQGCSSCPPANKFVAGLVDAPDTLVLSYGVTYWDYLGWKDTFGKPEFTARQRAYGRALGASNVYTPQIILNGSEHSARYSKKDVSKVVLDAARPQAILAPYASNTITTGDSLAFTYNGETQTADIRVLVVGYKPGLQTVSVKKGENRGRALTLANVVTEIMPLDQAPIKSGQSVMTGIMPTPDHHYVALVHHARTAEIITAARYAPAP